MRTRLSTLLLVVLLSASLTTAQSTRQDRPGGASTTAAAAATASTAGGRLDRVLDPPALPPDARLGPPRSLDAPFPFKPAFRSSEEWRTRADALRKQILVAVGLWPMPQRTGPPPKVVIYEGVQRDGYTIEKVFFESLPGHYVSGNLYRPRPGAGLAGQIGVVKRPAVLSPHGHWSTGTVPSGRLLERTDAESRQRVDAGGEKTMEGARYPLQARLAGLARLGVVVFMYDMVGYGDSRPIVHREGFTDAEAELRLQTTMGLQIWNSIRALDFLASLPDVDATRIGVTGESGGGTQTFILGAIDGRPVAAFPAVMVSGAMQGGCVCENAPLLRVGTNNIEIAALFAPKPLGMSAANDWTKDLLTLGLPELTSIYGLLGAEDRVMGRHFPYEHNFNQLSRELMYDWFNTHLKLGHKTPIAEPPFTPATPAELSVYDNAHPLPSDAVDAATLRRTMTRASDREMSALVPTPAQYRVVVDTALRAMIQEPLPVPSAGSGAASGGTGTAGAASSILAAPIPGTFKALSGDGFDVHLTLLTRPGSGDAVPAAGLVPKGYKGGPLVIWAHPAGKASLFEADGRTPTRVARDLLTRGVAILAADVFLTGEFNLPGVPTTLTPVKDEARFATFNHGYNRTVLAQRAHDLLTLVAFARTTLRPSALHLVAVDRAGVWALLARALAGDAIDRASIDLDGFDFGQVTVPLDEMMLPGGLKYGGVHAFLSLCTAGQTEVYDAPPASLPTPATPAVTIRTSAATPDAMTRWVLAAPAAAR